MIFRREEERGGCRARGVWQRDPPTHTPPPPIILPHTRPPPPPPPAVTHRVFSSNVAAATMSDSTPTAAGGICRLSSGSSRRARRCSVSDRKSSRPRQKTSHEDLGSQQEVTGATGSESLERDTTTVYRTEHTRRRPELGQGESCPTVRTASTRWNN